MGKDGILTSNFGKDSISYCYINSQNKAEYGIIGKTSFQKHAYLQFPVVTSDERLIKNMIT